MRLSAEKRERFLEVLGQTGNRSAAAAAIGVEPRLMDQRRRFDPLLDRQWDEAIEQSQRRLAGANGPLDCIGGAEPMVIRRGKGGRLKLVKAGTRRWSGPVEEKFFATLASCGNIAASARAVGFSESCIHQRRRKWPAFAERLDEALEDAEYEVEFQVAAEVRRMSRARGASQASAAKTDRFDMDAAIRFLKWRDEKRHGYGRRGRSRKGPPDRDGRGGASLDPQKNRGDRAARKPAAAGRRLEPGRRGADDPARLGAGRRIGTVARGCPK
jgi:hypothetical protein